MLRVLITLLVAITALLLIHAQAHARSPHTTDNGSKPVYVGGGRYTCEGRSDACKRFEAQERARQADREEYREQRERQEDRHRNRERTR